MKITDDDVVDALNGLPEEKKHCSNLGVKALRNAIDNYLKITKWRTKNENSNTGRG